VVQRHGPLNGSCNEQDIICPILVRVIVYEEAIDFPGEPGQVIERPIPTLSDLFFWHIVTAERNTVGNLTTPLILFLIRAGVECRKESLASFCAGTGHGGSGDAFGGA